MNTIRAVTDEDMPRKDQEQILACLKQWQQDGHTNPLIPCDADMDGDGTTDAFGLGLNGELVYVSGAAIGDTVSQSTGEDLDVDRSDDNG